MGFKIPKTDHDGTSIITDYLLLDLFACFASSIKVFFALAPNATRGESCAEVWFVMIILFFLIIYASGFFFLLACAVRAVRYARMPLHLRWELYPVPHEGPERARHGGSYFEVSDWSSQPGRLHFWGDIRYMVPEILFLKGLWEANRKLWFRSYPFHSGLYLLTGTAVLVAFRAVLILFLPTVASGLVGLLAAWVCKACGMAGGLLAMIGAATLLQRRLADKDLSPYSTPGDIFNLAFFLVILGLLSAGYLLQSPDTAGIEAVALAILTMDTRIEIGGLLAAGLIAGALLLAYIPCTHMAHFIGKYFTYHAVRWDDLPVTRRAELRARVARNLALRPTWAAAHIGANGKKTWGEIATADPGKRSAG